MSISHTLYEELHAALLDAFSRAELTLFVRTHLDANFEALTADKNLTAQVDELLRWTERRGRVRELAEGAVAERPRNAALQSISAELAKLPANALAPRLPGDGWRVPFPRNEQFVGRGADLAALHAALQQGAAVGIRPAGLTGLGGIGKTQLALEYCYASATRIQVVSFGSTVGAIGGDARWEENYCRRCGVECLLSAPSGAYSRCRKTIDLIGGARRRSCAAERIRCRSPRRPSEAVSGAACRDLRTTDIRLDDLREMSRISLNSGDTYFTRAHHRLYFPPMRRPWRSSIKWSGNGSSTLRKSEGDSMTVDYPDIKPLLAAKEQRRQALAALSWEENVAIVDRMRRLLPRRQWHKPEPAHEAVERDFSSADAMPPDVKANHSG